MMRNSLRAAIFMAGAFVSADVFAHQDDPKVLDRQPPYPGPGWKASSGLPAPRGFPASGVQLRSWLTLGDLSPGATSGNDCWGYVSPSGREYAIVGVSNGTAFVEITDPDNATLVVRHTGPESLWRDIKVYQSYAYSVSEGGSGIQVFDMTNIDSGTVTFVRSVTTGGTTATHNVALDPDSGFLYRCGGDNNGLRIYSLADPSNPTLVATWSDRYVHDAQIVTYTDGPYAGKQIAFCCSGFNGGFDETGLDILDVTNKSNIQLLSRTFYPTPGYSHQGWLSPDRKYFYLDDELDEDTYGIPTTARVINVSNLSSPFVVSTYTNNNSSIDHNMYTRNNLIYAANYRSGLRVFDASIPEAPVQIAWFDTYPDDDTPQFNGMWSNYPQFPSGTVIGSDLERGLFVFRVTAAPIAFMYPDGLPETLSPAGGVLNVRVFGQNGGVLQAGSPALHLDSGSGFTEIPLTSLGGDLYQAVFPSLPCGSTIEFFLSAESTEGVEQSSPFAAPSSTFSALVSAGSIVLVDDPVETNSGWTVGMTGDNATTGLWTRVNPNGTAAQPEDDHSPSGTFCWVTGQGSAGGGVGDADVDGGRTTLRTPGYDLTSATDPRISYWRWYSNTAGAAPNADTFRVDISNGGPWVNAETVGPAGSETSGGWFFHEIRVLDYVALSANVQLRFVAEDVGSGSIIEAAVDDLLVSDIDCPVCPADLDGDSVVGLPDLSIQLANFGSTNAQPEDGDLDLDGDVDLTDLSLMLGTFGSACS